jgi:hypothetical protein
MRKAFLVLLAMTMATTMAFAQVQVEYDLSAEATATFGVNLDKASDGTDTVESGPTTGFQLENTIDFSVTFVEETTEEFGEGDVYGWIEVDGFEFVADGDAAEDTPSGVVIYNGEISAKLFLGPAYIVIATAENDVNQAELGLNVDESILGAGDKLSDPDTSPGHSVAVGFDVPDLMNIEAVIGSVGDWSENTYNNYVGAIYTKTSVAGFTISVDLAATLRDHGPKELNDDGEVKSTESLSDFGDDGFVGIGVGYEMALDDMMTLAPYLGLDLQNSAAANAGDGAMDFEVIAGANVLWGADDLEVFAAASDESLAGAGLEVGFARVNTTGDGVPKDSYNDSLWVRVGLAEEGGDDGLFPVIGAAVIVEYVSTTPTADGTAGDAINSLSFGAEVDADLGTLSPFFGLMYADTNLDTDNDADLGVYSEGLTMNLGTDISVIPATTFTIKYTSGNLLLDDDGLYDGTDGYYSYEAARGEDTATAKTGTFTIATTIEY